MTEKTKKRRTTSVGKQVPITELTICGYKSIKDEIPLPFRPLTVLAGANSSGKSSMMQPLLLLKQTLEATYDPGPLLLNGPNIKFTSSDQLFFTASGAELVDKLSIGLKLGGGESLTLHFGHKTGKKIDLQKTTYQVGEKSVTLCPEMSESEIEAALTGMIINLAVYKRLEEPPPKLSVQRNRCFFEIVVEFLEEGMRAERYSIFPHNLILTIQNIIHVPGLRGNPERTYPVTAIGPMFPGTFEKYTASVIAQWKVDEPAKHEQLGQDLAHLGLTWKIMPVPLDDTQVELRVGRLIQPIRGGAKDYVNIADVGFGVSQTLPVLTALLAAQPGQMVYLEQPEIHLHPRAQLALAQLLVNAACRGIYVVAETHSSLLLRGIQTCVAQGKISPEKIKFHWFHRNKEGITAVTSADLDESGAFGDWPEDFDEVNLSAESNYLDSAEIPR